MQIDFYPEGKGILLILTGAGGNTKGYENKYVTIAESVREKYGFSVFVAGVPQNCWENPKQVFCEAVEQVFVKTTPEKIYIMGSSAGATLALWYSHLFEKIERVLAINPVLNLNFHNTDEGVKKFCGERMYVISGEKDPCAMWQEILPQKATLIKKIIAGADHTFTGKLNEFTALPDMLFSE